MANKNDLILSLSEDTFFTLKKDFDSILNRTIGNMEMKGASDATITLKLTVSLDKRSVTVGDSIHEFKRPTFKHDISSVMQIKDKATGQLGGEYAMVWDPDEERFVLRQFTGGQASIFDEDYETAEEEWGTFRDLSDDFHSLPAPAETEEDEQSCEAMSNFDWLSQFIGEKLIICEAMGNYSARTEDNRLVLSSATGVDSPFYCPAEKLAPHVGHQVVCAGYGEDAIVNVSIECEDCSTVLFDLDAPETELPAEEETAETAADMTEGDAAEEDAAEEDESRYEYETPEE